MFYASGGAAAAALAVKIGSSFEAGIGVPLFDTTLTTAFFNYTNALIWLAAGHARSRPLLQRGDRVYVSPASVLELQFLHESGKVRLRNHVEWVVHGDRWLVDEPPAGSWFLRATEIGLTRDPFDRLLVAHAQVRRWRLATADARILEHLGPAASVEL